MEEVEINDGVHLLRFPKDNAVPDDKIIRVVAPQVAALIES